MFLVGLALFQVAQSEAATEAELIGQIIAYSVFVATGLVLIGFGTEQILRRVRSRRLRVAIGQVDDLTKEELTRFGRGVRIAFGRLWSKEVTGSSEV